MAICLSELQLRFLFLVQASILLVVVRLLLVLTRFLNRGIVAQGKSEQEFFEDLMLMVIVLQQLVSDRGLKPVEHLRLIGEVLQRLALVLVTDVRGVPTISVIVLIAAVLLPTRLLSVVAEDFSYFKGSHIPQVVVNDG